MSYEKERGPFIDPIGLIAPARVDADRTAKPRTALLAHVEVKARIDGRTHGIVTPPRGADTIVDMVTGRRTDLYDESHAYDESYDVHIVPMEPAFNGDSFVVALCGARATFDEDDNISPPEFDFFFLGHGHEGATCTRCRATVKGT